jgi:hypothetical protein
MSRYYCFQSKIVMQEEEQDYELETFSSSKIPPPFLTFSASFETLPIDMVLCILEKLNMSSRAAVVVTCKYFNSIWESAKNPIMKMYYIPPKDIIVNWQLLQCFEHAFKYAFLDLAINTSECPTKALLWIHDNRLSVDALKLLRGFVSEYSKTPILFWKGDPIFEVNTVLYNLLLKLKLLKCLCISGGCLDLNWPKFFRQFEQLKLIYFRPSTINDVSTVWTMDTPETFFIMELVEIEPRLGDIQ